MSSQSSTNAVSPAGSSSPVLGDVSSASSAAFSPTGNALLSEIADQNSEEGLNLTVRPDPTVASTNVRHIPAMPPDDEDAISSVSQATAVASGLKSDLGTRVQERACQIEDELSRYCLETANRIPVNARHFIMARVFELVKLCSDLRVDAASERGAVMALQGQLVETRREVAEFHRRAILAEPRTTTAALADAAFPPAAGPSSQPQPGLAVGPHVGLLPPTAPTPPAMTYAAALQVGAAPAAPSTGPHVGTRPGSSRARRLRDAHLSDFDACPRLSEASQGQYRPGRPRHPRRHATPNESPDPSTASVEQRHIPASDRDNEDALSSVSQTTAVLTTSRLDVGTRVQARAREIEEELSRFCLDAGNRIPVNARHFIMARVFELVELCSDLRANAASERGAVLALKDQLTETRRENTALHQRAILAESRSCLLPSAPAADDAAPAAFLTAPPGRPAVLLPTSGPGLPGHQALRTYAAALSSGLEPSGPSSRTLPGGTSAPVLPPVLHEHVAFVTPLAPSTTPARDTLRLIKANIDPVEKDIRDVMLRHTRFSGVDPDVPPDDFVARLAERNPQLGLDLNACKVKTSLRERSGTQAMIVEVDPQAFARILQQPRLSVGWTSIRAAEDLHVPTCTFCAQVEARVLCGTMRHAQCARVVAQRATWARTVQSAWATPPSPVPNAAGRDWRPAAILQAIPSVRY
ncbi:hypothetical protein HPB52_023797 [Rhipicephalus sanguineus]|uniref:Uncharacterized protein n=1 Tax=Rhipicephalus sanguineus TaxID=34632 RepID=A0A9D4Q3U4_RHISA|nr:hypothetical protein HPB52_023797 [Rhipicephalus sanguineus]